MRGIELLLKKAFSGELGFKPFRDPEREAIVGGNLKVLGWGEDLTDELVLKAIETVGRYGASGARKVLIDALDGRRDLTKLNPQKLQQLDLPTTAKALVQEAFQKPRTDSEGFGKLVDASNLFR